ncbi:MAG: alpha-isopropylmalate synthase regulatory domain-containing protein, partial [Methanobacterium sp.]
GNKITPTASIRLNINNTETLEAGIGIGPVDAAIVAVKKSIKDFADIELEEYHVDAITGGADALIDVIVKLKHDDKIVTARSTQPDIIMASVEAYLSGINKILSDKDIKNVKEGDL